ncbi:MAG: hypothetical protein U5L00_05280 [Desulfovermiculus sp.]|nr:hypothetical protein [Desulfovermiculus sp.]
MGTTIHYKGRLNDPAEIDAVTDFVQQRAVAKGWSWTHIDDDWDVEVDAQLVHTSEGHLELTGHAGLKGFSLDIDPKCEAVPLLFDSSGNLRSVFSFFDPGSAEEGDTIAVKTQFAPPEAHMQIIELLRELKRRFMVDLEVMDEGEYWETQDPALLEKKMAGLQRHIDFLSDALQSEHCKGLRNLPPEELAREIERMLDKGTEDQDDQD